MTRPPSNELLAWFGDSVVVDDQGYPKVVYHGTSKDVDFKAFKVPRRGVWFAEDPEDANEYASQNDSQNSVYTRTPDGWRFVPRHTSGRVFPVYLRIESPYQLTPDEYERFKMDPSYARVQGEIFSRALAAGHDGIYLPGGHWVVLESPNQIKSAVGNKGTYSRSDKVMTNPGKPRPSTSAAALRVEPRAKAEQRAKRFLRAYECASGVEDLSEPECAYLAHVTGLYYAGTLGDDDVEALETLVARGNPRPKRRVRVLRINPTRKLQYGESPEYGNKGFRPTERKDFDYVAGLTTAHDMLEHLDTDPTIQGEFRALGAIVYVRQNDPRANSISSSLASDMSFFYPKVLSGEIATDDITPTPKRVKKIPEAAWFDEAVFLKTCARYTEDAIGSSGDFDEVYLYADAKAAYAEFCKEAIPWIRKGYWAAAKAYGNHNKAWATFKTIQQAVDAALKEAEAYGEGQEFELFYDLETGRAYMEPVYEDYPDDE